MTLSWPEARMEQQELKPLMAVPAVAWVIRSVEKRLEGGVAGQEQLEVALS
jgi:hypothetical protein